MSRKPANSASANKANAGSSLGVVPGRPTIVPTAARLTAKAYPYSLARRRSPLVQPPDAAASTAEPLSLGVLMLQMAMGTLVLRKSAVCPKNSTRAYSAARGSN